VEKLRRGWRVISVEFTHTGGWEEDAPCGQDKWPDSESVEEGYGRTGAVEAQELSKNILGLASGSGRDTGCFEV
jgi:hypothetical protein